MTLGELSGVDPFRDVVSTSYALTTFTPNPDNEIARNVVRFQQKRQTKELCA